MPRTLFSVATVLAGLLAAATAYSETERFVNVLQSGGRDLVQLSQLFYVNEEGREDYIAYFPGHDERFGQAYQLQNGSFCSHLTGRNGPEVQCGKAFYILTRRNATDGGYFAVRSSHPENCRGPVAFRNFRAVIIMTDDFKVMIGTLHTDDMIYGSDGATNFKIGEQHQTWLICDEFVAELPTDDFDYHPDATDRAEARLAEVIRTEKAQHDPSVIRIGHAGLVSVGNENTAEVTVLPADEATATAETVVEEKEVEEKEVVGEEAEEEEEEEEDVDSEEEYENEEPVPAPIPVEEVQHEEQLPEPVKQIVPVAQVEEEFKEEEESSEEMENENPIGGTLYRHARARV